MIGHMHRRRLKPSFIIIGAQKAGTSALFSMLSSHPLIEPPKVKEHHFFDIDENYRRGKNFYLRAFPCEVSKGLRKITFEATPSYLYSPVAAERIASMFPEIRIVAMLRDPVKRAYSAWNMRRQFKDHPVHGHRHDPRSFEEAIRACLMFGPGDDFRNDLLERGDYAPQLERYFQYLGRSNCLILNYCEFLRSPAAILDRIVEHVGLCRYDWPLEILDRKDNKRQYTHPMSDEIRLVLNDYFAERIQLLNSLMGYEMSLYEG